MKYSYFIKVALAVLVGLSNFYVGAQNVEKLFENAEKVFYSEDFESAVVQFQMVLDVDPKFEDAEYKQEIARLLLITNREASLDKILSYKDTKGRGDKFYYYWLGRIYSNRYMFPEALRAWKTFLNRKTAKSKVIVEETKSFISEAKALLTYFDNPDNYEIHKLESPINTSRSELTPVFNKETQELIYASATDDTNSQYKIYSSKRQSDRSWSAPEELTSLGVLEQQNANIEIVDEDGKLFIFKDVNGGDLYYSQLKNDNWTVPVEFDSKVTSTHLKSHFFINEHEDRIIFSSDKRKKNGLDLYESFKDANSGAWSKPVPFASSIDTEWNEDSPYLSPDEKRLYFSSDRQGGIGGYDIYVSVINEETLTWGEPENLGWPINSPDNDFHFKLNPDGRSGYFVSDRIHSTGSDDIFFFWEVEKTKIQGKIKNIFSGEPIENGEIRFHPTSYYDEYFRSKIGSDGSYNTELIANETFIVEVLLGSDTLHKEEFSVIEEEGENITHVKDFEIFPIGTTKDEKSAYLEKKKEDLVEYVASEINKNTVTQTIESIPTNEIGKEINNQYTRNTEAVAQVEELGSKYRVGNKVVLHNIYFDFGTSKLKSESNDILNRILKTLRSNKGLYIEIGGYTDNIGSLEDNIITSERRAQAVKKWLVKRGIESERLLTKGYGEAFPLASNDDEVDGRALNRRIEIRIVKEL